MALELFARGGDLASTAEKTGRRWVSLVGGSNRELEEFRGCALPRLQAIAKGQSAACETDYVVEGQDTARPTLPIVLSLGAALANFDPTQEYPQLVVEPAEEGLAEYLERILSADGFLITEPADGKRVRGRSLDGTSNAVILGPEEFLDSTFLAEVASRDLAPQTRAVTVYYFRAADDVSDMVIDPKIGLRRVPMELRV